GGGAGGGVFRRPPLPAGARLRASRPARTSPSLAGHRGPTCFRETVVSQRKCLKQISSYTAPGFTLTLEGGPLVYINGGVVPGTLHGGLTKRCGSGGGGAC